CYHYVVTAVTKNGERPESEEVMGVPASYVCVMHFGTEGYDDGEFKSPTGIALDREGHIYVADTDTHTIQKFDKDGTFLMRLGDEAGDAEGQFYYPRGLACTSQGDLIVIDANNHRVQKFDKDGNFLTIWGKFGFAWKGASQGVFDIPAVEERPFKGAFLAPHEDRLPVDRVLLDPVIEGVGDVDIVVLVDAHAPRIVEDSLRCALPGEAELAPDGQEVPVLVELLDAVVIGVNNDQVALGGAGQAAGIIELAFGVARLVPQAHKERPILVELLDRMRV